MQLTPRYGEHPLITLDGCPGDILGPVVRQRRRLVAHLGTFTDEQWAQPSRCEGWSNRDVIVHLDSVNAFWGFSIAAGLKGEPTQFLATFDPVTGPADLVAGSMDLAVADVLDRFGASTESLTGLLESLDEDSWSVVAEAPPGHLSISAVAHHALWDSWVHERDILLPMGIAPEERADEIVAGLRYVAALAPAFAVNGGTADKGVLAIDATEPDVAIVVEVGDRVDVRAGAADHADLLLAGDAVELLEALSLRGPLEQAVPAESAWLVNGLAEIFDAPR